MRHRSYCRGSTASGCYYCCYIYVVNKNDVKELSLLHFPGHIPPADRCPGQFALPFYMVQDISPFYHIPYQLQDHSPTSVDFSDVNKFGEVTLNEQDRIQVRNKKFVISELSV